MAAEIDRHGLTLVHPYNDWNVIAGQGTAALELLEQAGPLDAVIAPVGGGGLLSGTALAVKGRSPGTSVKGAEPAAADDACRSLKTGAIQPSLDPRTIADGLRTSLGTRTFAVISRHVDEIFTVSEAEIIDATRFVWERIKIVIEPSSAVVVAPLLAGRLSLARPPRRRHPQRRQRRRRTVLQAPGGDVARELERFSVRVAHRLQPEVAGTAALRGAARPSLGASGL